MSLNAQPRLNVYLCKKIIQSLREHIYTSRYATNMNAPIHLVYLTHCQLSLKRKHLHVWWSVTKPLSEMKSSELALLSEHLHSQIPPMRHRIGQFLAFEKVPTMHFHFDKAIVDHQAFGKIFEEWGMYGALSQPDPILHPSTAQEMHNDSFRDEKNRLFGQTNTELALETVGITPVPETQTTTSAKELAMQRQQRKHQAGRRRAQQRKKKK
eukprot:TRINITY_DN52947_c0_g1_i1.p1 TRINITY_DN52947_c0_g1~~TRINITY_DN52947_c0_g1_i1.p1  ORF type:complete len:211 (+),score=11.48 TRINITY_DN52947_c0_g1_i1:19-651(+)